MNQRVDCTPAALARGAEVLSHKAGLDQASLTLIGEMMRLERAAHADWAKREEVVRAGIEPAT
jgi:hypothetical protein